MYDVQLQRGAGAIVTYTLVCEELSHTISKELTHSGIVDPANNYAQDAILLDTGRANEIIKISGSTWRTQRIVNYAGTDYTFPGLVELETAIKDWWIDIQDPLSGSGMPRLYENPNTYWVGVFGDCKLYTNSDEIETLHFEITFNAIQRVAA